MSTPTHLPAHVGVVMDGNRRWARAAGHANPSIGHRVGAEHVEELLGWCVDADIHHLTTYVLSADNIRKRSAPEVAFLFDLLAGTLPDLVRRSEEWSLHVSGDLALLPIRARSALDDAVRDTAGRPRHLVRTSGEHRLSGFLPWQTAHSEVVVCDRPWPAFQREDFEAALCEYDDRTDRSETGRNSR